jgi:hypothetical protein
VPRVVLTALVMVIGAPKSIRDGHYTLPAR